MNEITELKLKYAGYTKSFFFEGDNIREFDEYELVTINSKMLQEIVNYDYPIASLLDDNNSIIYFKVDGEYSITIDDFKNGLTRILDEKIPFLDVIKYSRALLDINCGISSHYINIQHNFKNLSLNSFKDETALLNYLFYYFFTYSQPETYLSCLEKIIHIINIFQTKDYDSQDPDYLFFKCFIIHFFIKNEFSIEKNDECYKYFVEKIDYLLSIKHYDTIILISKYIEDDYGLMINSPDNTFNYLKEFLKYYQDLEIIEAIGKISHNSKKHRTQAYKYLSYAYFKGGGPHIVHYLADCFYNGWGIAKDRDTSHRILINSYNNCIDAFHDNDTDVCFDKICIRLGNEAFEKKEINEKTLSYYLQARAFIFYNKIKLNVDTSFLDVFEIKNGLDNLNSLVEEREFKYNGIKITKYIKNFNSSFENVTFEIDKINGLMTLNISENYSLHLNCFPLIRFSELTKKFKFILKLNDDIDIDQLEKELEETGSVVFRNGQCIVEFFNAVTIIDFYDIYYVSSIFNDISKKYVVVTFKEEEAVYSCLLEDFEEKEKREIIYKEELYEDELYNLDILNNEEEK